MGWMRIDRIVGVTRGRARGEIMILSLDEAVVIVKLTEVSF